MKPDVCPVIMHRIVCETADGILDEESKRCNRTKKPPNTLGVPIVLGKNQTKVSPRKLSQSNVVLDNELVINDKTRLKGVAESDSYENR